jgi:3-oxoacyl-[acyl-carrier protein] reductase
MDLQLAGQSAIVTGSSRGIGAAIARELAREGVSVVVNYARDREGAESVCADILERGGRASAFQADVGDRASAGRLVDFALKQYGGLDILVNNAGAISRAPFLDTTEEELDLVIATNFKGVWNCCQAAGAYMAEKRYGRILNCSSVAVTMPVAGSAAYAASKAAVQTLTQVLAGELAPFNILVNAYMPGTFDTSMVKASLPKRGEELLNGIGLRRLGKPEEIASVVAFLVSPVNSYMSGSVVMVHGAKLSVQNPSKPWRDAGLV